MEAMPAIRRKLEQELEALSSPDQAKAWVNRCLDYTLQGGKMHRGKMVLAWTPQEQLKNRYRRPEEDPYYHAT